MTSCQGQVFVETAPGEPTERTLFFCCAEPRIRTHRVPRKTAGAIVDGTDIRATVVRRNALHTTCRRAQPISAAGGRHAHARAGMAHRVLSGWRLAE